MWSKDLWKFLRCSLGGGFNSKERKENNRYVTAYMKRENIIFVTIYFAVYIVSGQYRGEDEELLLPICTFERFAPLQIYLIRRIII